MLIILATTNDFSFVTDSAKGSFVNNSKILAINKLTTESAKPKRRHSTRRQKHPNLVRKGLPAQRWYKLHILFHVSFHPVLRLNRLQIIKLYPGHQPCPKSPIFTFIESKEIVAPSGRVMGWES